MSKIKKKPIQQKMFFVYIHYIYLNHRYSTGSWMITCLFNDS